MNEPNKEFNPYDPEVSDEEYGKWVDQQIENMRKRKESIFVALQYSPCDVNTNYAKNKWETLEKTTKEHHWRQRQSTKNIQTGRGIDDDDSES